MIRVSLLLATLALLLPSLVHAHTVWLRAGEQAGSWKMLFGGHEGKIVGYAPEKLTSVAGVAANGGKVGVSRTMGQDGFFRLTPEAATSLIVIAFDNGIHTRRSDGPSIEKPMNEVPTAISAVKAQKFHKTIVRWDGQANRAVGQPFEVVPVSATQPRAGAAMQVKVLIDGKPAPGIGIAHDEEGKDVVTDAQGIASFAPRAGYNKLWAGQRTDVADNPAYTQLSIEYTLGFEAVP